MPLSWNEIRSRAVAFSREWAGESREQAEAKTFWDEFFRVFGLSRRNLASFEEPVKNLGGNYGFIDLFWKGVLLAEHKSRGKDLDKAHAQAIDYIQSLQREDRGDEVPRYVIVSDFARIALHDLEEDLTVEFLLAEFHEHVHHFGFIPGYKQHKLEPEDPINIRAVQILGDLHDALEAGGYSGHELERLLVRVLFCLFAEDTGIFQRDAFQLFVENHTEQDGSNLGPMLAQFFQALNRPQEQRQSNLLEELAELPYVNGDLFAESLSLAAFDRDMRNRLIACTRFDWSRISPAVFGALFQAVMEPRERRQIGAHYTSERDILKVIGPLFLDDLKATLDRAGNDKNKLRKLHQQLAEMRLFDPACGCGNFLVVSYRELRMLELDILRRLLRGQQLTDIGTVLKLDVDQMYGIEIEEWPARIAEVAMWLMDHQMNQRLSEEFGEYFVRLPLRSSPHIRHGNALRTDWSEVLPAAECTHVLGNPPFVGKKARSDAQKEDMEFVLGQGKGRSVLDYVTCWYAKACDYTHDRQIDFAFVSTNSITQGEQPGELWPLLRSRSRHQIRFAYRTFSWKSDARSPAHVHVVVVGLSESPTAKKLLYETDERDNTSRLQIGNINAYLVNADDVLLTNRRRPICDVERFVFGNMPNDGGHLLLTDEEREQMVRKNPQVEKYVRRFLSAREYFRGIPRYCLWLEKASPNEIRSIPALRDRVAQVKAYREKSRRPATRRLASVPALFGEIRQPASNFVLMPRHSSENRQYIPVSFFDAGCIVADSCLAMANAALYEFGVISSALHMAWVRHVAGRIKSDYRYSATLVYNNFPWPADVTDTKRAAVEKAARAVLDARDAHPDASLADLYDRLAMPANLTKAHATLDRAVDRCYRSHPFPSERNRAEHLFKLHQNLTAPLLPNTKNRRKN